MVGRRGRTVVDDGAPAFRPWLRLLDQPAAAPLGLVAALLDLGSGHDGLEHYVFGVTAAKGLVGRFLDVELEIVASRL